MAACRATFMPCPACRTHPRMTSPRSFGDTPARAIASFTTIAPRSAAGNSLSVPPKFAMGVRHALKMTASSEAANGFLGRQRGAGRGAHSLNRGVLGDLAEHETAACDVDHRQLGDDLIDDLHTGKRQRALPENLVSSVPRRVLHRHNH